METFNMEPVQFLRVLMKITTYSARHENMRNRIHNKILLNLWLYRANVYLEERFLPGIVEG